MDLLLDTALDSVIAEYAVDADIEEDDVGEGFEQFDLDDDEAEPDWEL